MGEKKGRMAVSTKAMKIQRARFRRAGEWPPGRKNIF